MNAAAIIVAGGCGKRFGSKKPKQFLALHGKPVFLYSVETFALLKVFKQIIVVVPKDYVSFARSVLLKRFAGKNASRFIVAEGGKERFDSVKNGLLLAKKDIDLIAVHDAARPLISKKDIMAVLKTAARSKAAIAVEKTKDTVKTVKNGLVLNTLDRSVLYNVQTPQIFSAPILFKAYCKKISSITTDDSMLIENSGVKVSAVETSSPNFKITTKDDFNLAGFLIKRR
ncbi:MAG: 2-C-methyl-D-erythritol 4-phosphate cytidylyltransferase [Endomicrobium sp.]|jgi:2-C-methyl-D-erythritol 4-phosphate cytidylyltransferase|nr:2-C-methyl-D-erythritol 4-phosphate cytidylyltransferase [Endomicrobium sp.]